ncbi:sugar ABC transporter substrate-binding protein [Streptomyces carminius]|uniref:Sugar ABC transporter substrate-binding protein n=1 Tax=Streptomyces carminius TaxID=2665496 RepID=A0A2M8LRF1_9ACTN|nr:extracellular solute-binding protein [Streptomyces carminius]PJE94530.1 sugar ABC transporter substrate-binding protein [Streptomyces carminius]
MRRGIGATALVAALALAATACGGGEDGGDSGKKGADGELSGTVEFWDTSGDAEKGFYQKVAEEFEDKHPGVEVKYVNVPFGEANNKFKNAAGGGSGAPDVMRTEVAWVADFAGLGYLAPLDDTVAVEDKDDFLPQAWGSTQFEGKTYGVPQVIDTLALFYNKELLDKAGVEVPRSVADIKNSTGKFAENGVTPFYLRGDDAYFVLPFLYGEGGDMLDADAKKITIDDPAGVRAFETIRDLVDSEAAITDVTDGWENMQKAFKDGKVAMMLNGPWAIEDTLAGAQFKGKEDNLGVAAVPAGSKAQGAPQGGHNYSVYAGSDNLDASYEFVKYMSSAEVQKRTTEELSLLPTRTSVYGEQTVKDNKMVQFFKPAVDKAVERPWIAEGNSLFEPIRVQLADVLTGRTEPEAAADKIGQEYAKLLKDGDWK